MHGFGAGVHEAHHFNGWNGVDDQFGQLDFAAGGRAKAGAEFENSRERIDNWRAMTEEQRAPGANVVDVFVAIDIEEMRAFAAEDEARSTAHAAKSAHGRVNATGDDLLSAGEQRFGLRDVHTAESRPE